MTGIRGGKLKLKGDKNLRKHHSGQYDNLPRVSKRDVTIKKAEKEQVPTGWSEVDSLAQIIGPIMIIAPDESPIILFIDENGMVCAKEAEKLGLGQKIAEIEPTEVFQVWLGQNLTPGQYSFKSSLGKYLSSDSLGKVTVNKDAVGPTEEWVLAQVDGGFAFQNVYGKYLCLHRESGRIRSDSESVGFSETFRIKCQSANKFKTEAKKTIEQPVAFDEIEISEAKKHMTWGGGRLKLKHLDRNDLFRAEKEGRLHETLLEQRMKSKHDPFC